MARTVRPYGGPIYRWLTPGLVLVASGISCSGEKLSSVKGTVLLENNPVDGAVVIFHPQGKDDIETVRPTAVTGSDGTFELTTGGSTGAPPGHYTVTITWPEETEKPAVNPNDLKSGKQFTLSGGKTTPKDRLEGRYASRTKSGLKAEVLDGDTQLDPFQLK